MYEFLHHHLLVYFLFFSFVTGSCNSNSVNTENDISPEDQAKSTDTIKRDETVTETGIPETHSEFQQGGFVNTGTISPAQIVNYAQTLIGIPYRYASSDPSVGFDCSGFITHVFNHFNITVPRSSISFTPVGKLVPVEAAKSGDLILFTGTDSSDGRVGHMGIVISNSAQLQFIHSTSGKAYGVTITPLNDYYRSRFVKVIRIFRQNDEAN